MKTVFTILIVIFFAAMAYYFYFGDNARNVEPISVEYVEAKKGPFVSSISTTGTIISRKVETVKSTSFGIILDSGFQNRDYVTKGSVIARIRLNDRDFQNKQQQLKLAQIDMKILREQRQQSEELFQAKAISERELKELKIREYKQQVHVNDIKEEMADKEIEASFDGMVVNKKFNHLDRVYNGTELFTLIDSEDISVELPIFQKDITKVHVGQQVIFTSNIFKDVRTGEISEISTITTQSGNQNYRQNRATTFNVYSSIHTLADDQILFGSNIDAEIVLGKKDSVISIPLEAILYRNDEKIVFTIADGKATQKEVQTGDYNENVIEIISGLTDGDRVITKGNLDVEDGLAVITKDRIDKQDKSYARIVPSEK
ncbi:efflux RND transporter periplasmic adaptor subunit [candidate division KSB1 bacterium]|nr:efflux RND transporter periplasmic adaptor subunit [candidate division KSB1 bacterium]